MSCVLLLFVCLLNVFVDKVTDTEKDTKAQNTVKDKDVSDWVASQQPSCRDQSESGYGTPSNNTGIVSEECDDDHASGSQYGHLESQTVTPGEFSLFRE